MSFYGNLCSIIILCSFILSWCEQLRFRLMGFHSRTAAHLKIHYPIKLPQAFGSISLPSLSNSNGTMSPVSGFTLTSSFPPKTFMNAPLSMYNFGKPSFQLSAGGFGVNPSSKTSSDTLRH